MNIIGIIPARYASTRFPAKPLVEIGGKSMIRRVYEQAGKARLLSHVVVATDNNEIFDHVKSFGGNVVMTKEEHPSGTDRCFEALGKTSGKFDFVINIQGDEPFIHPEQIDLLASALTKQTELATLVKKIEDKETLFNPNTPKVIFTKDKEAIYFSRQTIPYIRGAEPEQWLSKAEFYKHIGIYAYRTDILKAITSLETGSLEKSESLEQLRWLENGFKIKVEITTYESVGIDVPSDLEKIKDLI